jgi:hypothetical protein
MVLRIGISGVHRTGKTTLAKELAKRLGLPFIPVDASGYFKELGLDPKDNMSCADLMLVQKNILEGSREKWGVTTGFVSDRTPIDFAAYTVSNGRNCEGVYVYKWECVRALNEYFDLLVIVSPNPDFPIVVDNTKLHGHLEWSKRQVLHDKFMLYAELVDPPVCFIRPEVSDLNQRVELVIKQLQISQGN